MLRRLKACLNGDRDRSEHDGVPITPAELAVAARASVDAGAEAIHVHPRDAEGSESLLAEDIGATVAAVRLSCPGVPVGVSTGLWIAGGDPARRAEWVSGWSVLDPVHRPDFASVNLSEAGSPDLLATLAGFGIALEAGVWSLPDVALLKQLPDVRWLRILVEIEELDPDHPYGPVEQADRIMAAVAEVDSVRGVEILLHGKQTFAWALVAHAGRLRIPTRMGLEDVVVGPYNEPVKGNVELIGMALRVWESGRAV